jgi:hypothetical protein
MTMEVKMLEIRDAGTFIPVMCIQPLPDNEGQRYLLRRDGYSCDPHDPIVIMVDAQCRGASYDPYDWGSDTHKIAHDYIQKNWSVLRDGDVIDVEFILGKRTEPKISERHTAESEMRSPHTESANQK